MLQAPARHDPIAIQLMLFYQNILIGRKFDLGSPYAYRQTKNLQGHYIRATSPPKIIDVAH